MDLSSLRPRHLISAKFHGSPFSKAEIEQVLRTIIATQHAMDPDNWTPFTWEDYARQQTSQLDPYDQTVLEAMTSGGRLGYDQTDFLIPLELKGGYLTKEEDRYSVAQPLLEIMLPYAQKS